MLYKLQVYSIVVQFSKVISIYSYFKILAIFSVLYSQISLTRVPVSFNGERRASSIKGSRKTGCVHVKE